MPEKEKKSGMADGQRRRGQRKRPWTNGSDFWPAEESLWVVRGQIGQLYGRLRRGPGLRWETEWVTVE